MSDDDLVDNVDGGLRTDADADLGRGGRLGMAGGADGLVTAEKSETNTQLKYTTRNNQNFKNRRVYRKILSKTKN